MQYGYQVKKVDKLIFGHSKRLTLTLTMRAVTKRPPSKKKVETFDFLAVVLVQYLRWSDWIALLSACKGNRMTKLVYKKPKIRAKSMNDYYGEIDFGQSKIQ